jgi:multidrug efflux pump subunit AcrA (membrane-fusion protein)
MEEQHTTGESAGDQTIDHEQQSSSMHARPTTLIRTVTFTSIAILLSAVVTGSAARQGGNRFIGELKAEVAKLCAPADGVVEWMEVKPGQIVLPGTELFIIRDTQLEQQIRKAELTLDGFRVDLAAAAARSELELQQRTAELDAAAFETELKLTGLLQQQFQNNFETTALGDYLSLFDSLASTKIPPVDLRMLAIPRQSKEYDRLRAMIERSEVENGLDALQTRIDLCEARLVELQRTVENLPVQIEAAHRIPVIRASIDSVSLELDDLKELEAERSVKSPIYGMAGVLRVQELESVDQGDLLVEVFDRDREFVTVSLPTSLVAKLQADQHVKLHFPNDEDREGVIDSIPPQLMPEEKGENSESTFSLKVRSIGKPWPTLPIGSSLEVSIH